MQVSSTTTRSQAQNVEDCLAKVGIPYLYQLVKHMNAYICTIKLHATILAASKALIKNEPSEAQKKKVENLQKAEKARRKTDKMHRSNLKRSRSNSDW
jgi:peptidyl-tRNA hydrolase ICT1